MFWKCCDKTFEKHSGMRRRMNLFCVLGQGETLRRIAPWKEDAGEDTKGIYNCVPISEVFHDSTKEITGAFDRASISTKTKAKTRGDTTNRRRQTGLKSLQPAKTVSKLCSTSTKLLLLCSKHYSTLTMTANFLSRFGGWKSSQHLPSSASQLKSYMDHPDNSLQRDLS